MFFYRLHKPGSRGPRDGSSGYDSSDNDTPSQQHYKHKRKYRSDPDFRMQNLHQSYEEVRHLLFLFTTVDFFIVNNRFP